MPELPEVETVVRSLRSALTGERVREVRCHYPTAVGADARAFCAALRGRTFEGFHRHGKYIFFLMSGGKALALHLRMTGQLFLAGRSHRRDEHTHVEMDLAGSAGKLVYRDVRKFGRFQLLPGTPEDFVQERALGPDALTVTSEHLERAFARTSRCVKAVLLDQGVIAGLGNIYTDEVLFRTRVAPQRRAQSLSEPECRELTGAVREVLYAAIAGRGTSISDFVDLEGEPGGYQFALQVYGRAGEPCVRCGALIQRAVVAGRGTWHCPACQR